MHMRIASELKDQNSKIFAKKVLRKLYENLESLKKT